MQSENTQRAHRQAASTEGDGVSGGRRASDFPSLPHFPALTFPVLPIPKRSHAEQGTAPPAPHGCAVQLHGRVRNVPCPLSPTPSLSPFPPRRPRCPQSRIYVMRGRERCVRRIPELSSQPLQTHFYLPKCGSSAPSMKAAEPAEAVG